MHNLGKNKPDEGNERNFFCNANHISGFPVPIEVNFVLVVNGRLIVKRSNKEAISVVERLVLFSVSLTFLLCVKESL